MQIYTRMLLETELFFQGHLRNVKVDLYHFYPKVTARLFTCYGSRIPTHSPHQLDGSLPANPLNERRVGVAIAVTLKSTFCLP